ncbi:Kinesin-like protein KIF27 [Tetrabaena socialis]|uniref:Kinesin-like protein KIF27 n=1 Tax=Tetrabaena socialis TaxID=47790 RepID=A0A2J8AJ15_9CHLO|nr:Kinesin-like protein KIF27 [Tetrabaena socialis]|eukprot:PNH12501.1 Kinesin-like protein KIF27 [Tetrabaena socialis]
MAEVRAGVRIKQPAVRSGGPPLSIRGQYGQFSFDYVIEEGANQEVTFNDCFLPQVNNFLQGLSSTVLVYGAGQTGKTYTLEGGPPASRTEGAMPRALHAIFKNLQAVPKHRYKLYITYCALSAGMEAQMVDLLAPGSAPVSLKDVSATSALARLLHYQAASHEDIYEVLRQGRMSRAAAFTSSSGSPNQAGGGGGGGYGRSVRPLTAAAHVMLNVQLSGWSASGEQLATNLTFVELAAPEAKVRGGPGSGMRTIRGSHACKRPADEAHCILKGKLAESRSQEGTGKVFARPAPPPQDMMGYPAPADSGLTRSLSLAYASLTAVLTALRAEGGREESPSRGHSHVPWRDSPLTRWLKAAADTLATLAYVQRLRSGGPRGALLVTATWDAAGGSAPGFGAAAEQQELQHSLLQRAAERERERFGSPIQMAPSLDTRYTSAPAGPASTHTHRSASHPRGAGVPLAPGGGAAASLRASLAQATPSSATPRSHVSSPPRRDPEPQGQPGPVQPLRASDLLPPGAASTTRGLPSQPSSSYYISQQQQQQQQQQQLQLQQQQQLAGGRLGTAGGGGGFGGRVAAAGGGGGNASSGVNAALDALGRQVEQLRAELGAEKRETQRLKAEVSHLESANRSAGDLAAAHAAVAQGELRNRVEALGKQLETSEGAKQLLVRRVQQLQEQQGSVLEIQAESSVLEAQVRALQDSLEAARSGHGSVSGQLADARAAAEMLRQDRDRLQRQNHELSDKLQAQVRSLSEETSRLRAQAMEAAGQVEAEQVARRGAEGALAQLRLQVEGSRGAEGSALQQAAALAAQVKELSAALEGVRAERNKLQEAKWRSDERAEQLGLEMEGGQTQRAKLEMEARAAATKSEGDLRSAIIVAEGLKVELANARAQLEGAKQELRTAQLAAEDSTRRESSTHTDLQEMESLLRELDRDLEVQVNPVWRQLRSERADSLFGVPESGALAPARRWRPVVQALVGVIKRNAIESERQSQSLEQTRERNSALEAQAARNSELASTLAAHQQLKAAQLSELEENRRGVALLDQALGEANRECERLHRQLEELSAAHKAFTAEAHAREARMQSHAAERETSLQVADREERLRSAMAEHDKRTHALAAEWEERLRAQVAERDARLRNAVMDGDARLQAVAADGEARVAAVAAEGEARLSLIVRERDAHLDQVVAEADARYREAVSERDARLAALSSEREALQRQLTSQGALHAEDKQERDVLRLRAHARDQLLHVVWGEVRAAQAACLSGGATPPRSPRGAAASSQSSPATAGMALLAAAEHEAGLDWAEPLYQERMLRALATVRVQVGKLQAELGALRSSSSLADDLSAQLGATRGRLAEAQRSLELLTSRAAGLEAELRNEQAGRASLHQQLASGEAAAVALQASLGEARSTMASLQEEAAVLAKSRDTWKDTATHQEAQLREMYADGEMRANELSRLRVESQAATTEASGSSARVRLLESQLQDAQSQLDTLSARLSATDKALADANTRAASLNGQLVLADSESRLRAQELMSRVQAAEDGEKVAKASAKDVMERLEGRLRDAGDQGSRLVAELDTLRGERNEAQLKADELQREALEARARLTDAEHVSRQLHRVMAERDALQEQVNGLRNAHAQGHEDVRGLRRQLDSAQEQLQRLSEEKTRLAAQVEGQRLEAIMGSMAPRTGGRIGALARPGGEAGFQQAAEAQRVAPPPFSRSYPAPYYGPPSVGASPTVARGPGAYAGPPAVPFSPPIAAAGSAYDGGGLRLGAPQGAGHVGAYGGEDPLAVRVHVRSSPPLMSGLR